MSVPRWFLRPKALAALACAAVLAPVAVVAGGVASARESTATTAQAQPTVDAASLYDRFYEMAGSFSYRISGADGDPRDPSDPFNVAPTVNGWQELYGYWKHALTTAADPSSLASSVTVSNHYFRRDGGYRFDSNDAEVTLPGAVCPGQRVLVAAHPDERPVPTDIVGLINSGSTSGVTGFGAARRHITDSNLGNEGAYDGLSGVALTLAEYDALIQWYDANGTYPKRTLKVALLDASRGATPEGLFTRDGSKYYAANLIPDGPQGQVVLFANMDSLGMNYPAYHLGTEFFWNNVTGGGVGPWFTFIKATPTAPNLAYPDTGSASAGANIAANSAAISAFRGNLQAALDAGFAQQGAKYNFSVPLENPLRYNQTGQAPTAAQWNGTVPVRPAYSPGDEAQYSPIRDDSDGLEDEQAFFAKGIPGFTVSGVKNSSSDENPYAASVSAAIKATPVIQYAGNQTTFQLGNGTPTAGMTTTAAASAAGDTNVKVASVSALAAGNPVFIDTGNSIEYRQIVTVGTAGAGGTGVTLSAPLRFAHAAGVRLHVNEGQPVGYLSDTIEHLNYFAAGAPHGPAGPEQPTEELRRALELPAQWTSLLLAGDDYLGAVPRPTAPVAYFETTPVKPTATLTVSFDGSFTVSPHKATLIYYWDFGDGSSALGAKVDHTYAGPTNADVKLVVLDGIKGEVVGSYRQAVAVGGTSDAAPATNACGTLSAAEQAALVAAARHAYDPDPPSITITTPGDGANYVLGSTVKADYSCSDDGSGVDTCTGTVGNGDAIDTTTIGSHTFEVHAADNAGNTSSKTVTYWVFWPFSGFLPPIAAPPAPNTVQPGATVPVKFKLGGDRGLGILAAGYPRSRQVDCASLAALGGASAASPPGKSGLTYDPKTTEYAFQWKTDKAWAGTCRELLVKLVDGSTRTADFTFRK